MRVMSLFSTSFFLQNACVWVRWPLAGASVSYRHISSSLFLCFCFIFYFILIVFNLLAKAVLQYDPNRIIIKNNISYGQWHKILLFFSSITSKLPRRTQTVYIVHPGLQDEGLQVTSLNYRMATFPAQGASI